MEGGERNIKLVVSYDGSNYLGWQIQAQGPTIQGVLEEAIQKVTQEQIRLIASGRTDTGVHALAQVANFSTGSSLELDAFKNGTNALTPPDIVIAGAEEMPLTFDARRSARSRCYGYYIFNNPIPSPIFRNYSWHIRNDLDVSSMVRAAELLVGEHDFSSFQASGCAAKHPVRRVTNVSPERKKNDFIYFEIEATAYLRHMVRNIIGTLVEVGRGKMPVARFQEIFLSRDRKQAGDTAPAQGLFLKKIIY